MPKLTTMDFVLYAVTMVRPISLSTVLVTVIGCLLRTTPVKYTPELKSAAIS